MIRIEHLCKAYAGKPVLRDFSLTMESGEHLCLMGLLADFDILFLDEPYKGLDAETKRAVQGAVGEYTRNKTVVLVTHDPAEAEGYRLVEMKPIV